MTNDMTSKEFRNKLRKDPHSVLNYISSNIDIIVTTNTKDTVYLVIPSINDNNLQELSQINVAGLPANAGSVSTLTTVGSLGSLASTIGGSTISSASTAGTIGTASTAK